ncbi:hypothetical protein AGRA3207_007350 [Actinomadura graeca]|uniref:Uncharacterized protein n=1 Tax=Actinomadura graeca TaxID=2750812 RepID=A0ABX8R424_9ACTN|nr:hypothetical protein [Actinomadura graeca]QXJ25799.1 hypothetical protein AGRA3207_007350 [Actinomadura graeca]
MQWLHTPTGCAIAVVTGVAGTLTGALILFVLAQGFDPPAAKDKVRSELRPNGDQDMRYTVQFNDPAYQIVTPAGINLTPRQQDYLRTWRWSSLNADANAYNLSRLIEEVRSAGGANLQKLNLVIKLEGRRNQPLFVDNVHPVNIKRTKPYRGSLVNIPPQEGGETIKMMFDFDQIDPRAREVSGPKGGPYKPGDLFFNNRTLTVQDGQQDSLLIQSITTRQAVTFEIRIDYRIGNRPKHLDINNHGRPFALSPYNCVQSGKRLDLGQWLPGRMSYQDVWELGIEAIEHSTTPRNHPGPSPWCPISK